MKNRIALLPFIILCFWLRLPLQDPVTDSGRVVGVFDGDTIRVRLKDGREKTVRLLGINAAEIDDPRVEVQFLARMAGRFAFFHLYRKDIRLTYDWEREDKYGRTLAYVWVGAETLFNEFILQEGYAFVFLKYPFRKEFQDRFKAAGSEAKAAGRGLWHRGEYRVIPGSEAGNNLGELLSVDFPCGRVQVNKRFALLLAPGGEFQAFIPLDCMSLIPDLSSFEGKRIRATGFLENYEGRPEMKIFSPFQLKINQGRSPKGHP